MNESNLSMTLASIEASNFEAKDQVLEIGHGNCGHLRYILEKAENLDYTGLEISETMQAEAKRMNSNRAAQFVLYDGLTIPFENDSFDKLFTVNTVYFWKEPESFILEIERVLRKNGTFVLTLATKQFMEKLPFVQSRFSLFDEDSIRNLISHSQLTIEIVTKTSEMVMSKSLGEVQREFMVVKIKK